MIDMQELKVGSLLQSGKYDIEGMLGQGGFGITYKAMMKSSVSGNLGGMEIEVPVALKEFFMKDLCVRHPESSYVSVPSTGSKEQMQRYREKFVKEARNISALSHPHIVKVLDVFEENGTVYYAMQFLPGGSLRDRMKNGPMPEAEAVGYIRQIADALGYMHQQKHLCHYDVKPGNILLDNRGGAKLIDFGISKSYDQKGHETSSTPVGLSQGYAPIEQYQNSLQDFSPATDIYSLGATLLALLTGETPPEAADVFENGIGAQPAGISTKTWQAIQAAMNPHRKSRPQTVAAFLDILDNGLPEETRRVEEIQDAPTTPVDTSSDSQSRPDLQPPPETHVDYFFPKQKSNVKMYVIIVVVAALIGGGIFWAVSHRGGNTDAQQEQTAAMKVTDFPVTVKVDGKDLSFKYTGDIKDNLPEGVGEGVYTTNTDGVMATYKGAYHAGLRHGEGKLTFSSGDYYEGNFANDKYNGKGRYTFAPSKDDDDNTYAYYEGTYQDGKELNGTWYNRKGKSLVKVKDGKEQ